MSTASIAPYRLSLRTWGTPELPQRSCDLDEVSADTDPPGEDVHTGKCSLP